jgi:hypothetical protein
MKTEEIEEGNKLITLFMGYIIIPIETIWLI